MTQYLPSYRSAFMKYRVDQFLPDFCTIEKQMSSLDELGQKQGANWETVESSVPCRVLPYQTTREGAQSIAEAERMVDINRIILRRGTSIDADHRVTLASGEVFHIIELESQSTDRLYMSVLGAREKPYGE